MARRRADTELAEKALPVRLRAALRLGEWRAPGGGNGWRNGRDGRRDSGVGGFGSQALPVPTSQLALWLLLATVTMAFSMMVTAYVVRSGLPDWQSFPKPRILWLNTGLLVLSSAALERAKRSVELGDAKRLRPSLMAGGILGALFVLGQLAAWRLMSQSGLTLQANPSTSFFYLLTAVHGAHVLGGLVAWVRTWRTARGRGYTSDDHLGLDLCAVYWHFLLLVWLVLFALIGLA